MQKVAQYLGHSSTSVTERVYGRFAPDHLQDEAKILDFTRPVRIVS
jgi:integrase